MPLTPMPPDADENRKAKIYQLRKRILKNFLQKYLFTVTECLIPTDYLTAQNRLTGLIFQKNVYMNGNWKIVTDKRHSVNASLVISSIGSMPEKLDELPMEGNILEIQDMDSGKIRGYPDLFALGNVVTGRGNIRESLHHSRAVTKSLLNSHLDILENKYKDWIQEDESITEKRIDHLVEQLKESPSTAEEKIASLNKKIKNLQKKAGYDGNYQKWIKEHLPVRLEDLNA
jgi:hypothetical protein